MTTFNVSIREINRLIYALSALRSYYNRENPNNRVPLLTEDREEALTVIVESAIREVALKTGGSATQSINGIVEISLKDNGETIRRAFEQACALNALWLANIGYDPEAAGDYRNQASSAIDAVKNGINRLSSPPKIIPHWF